MQALTRRLPPQYRRNHSKESLMSATTEPDTNTVTEPVELTPVAAETSTNTNALEADDGERANVDDLENVNEEVLQKHRDRVAELEKERDNLAAEVLRHRVAADKDVPVNLLSGVTQEELEAAAEALLAFRAQPSGPIVPADGTASAGNGSASDWLRHELSKK
jgi:hypothetical protein